MGEMTVRNDVLMTEINQFQILSIKFQILLEIEGDIPLFHKLFQKLGHGFYSTALMNCLKNR